MSCKCSIFGCDNETIDVASFNENWKYWENYCDRVIPYKKTYDVKIKKCTRCGNLTAYKGYSGEDMERISVELAKKFIADIQSRKTIPT